MALLHVDFFSDVLGMCTSADVILPQQTSGQIGMEGKGAEGKLKTMYLLHGMSDDQTIWQRRTSIERYVSQLGIAVVMPTTHLAFYTDTTYGMRYWTYISEELPKICREFFPQMSDKKKTIWQQACRWVATAHGSLVLVQVRHLEQQHLCPAVWIL